jgi:aminoglycoside phosphotransferase (APT) family kinase protein
MTGNGERVVEAEALRTGGAVDDAAMRPAFRDWLAGRWPDVEALEVGEFRMPKSGFSARTVFVPVRGRRAARAFEDTVVLRLENPEPAIYPMQAPGLDVEIDIQYRAMQCLHATAAVPLAPLIGYEADAGVLGAPFFAMGYVPGQVMVEDPPYTQAGFFTTASPAERLGLVSEGLRMMAAVHAIDWRAAGFAWLLAPGEAPSLQRQVALWESYARRELGARVHPDLERGFERLHRYAPVGLEPGLSWGDSRPGNIIFRDGRCACLTDFENIAIAPVEIDLGWWLMFDRTQHECVGLRRLDGEPTREEQARIYAAHAGRAIGETHWFELFAAVRYAAIVVRVMNRLVDRGMMPPDHTIWLQNPAADALARVLAEG